MGKKYSFSFVGSGSVAWHLASALNNAGHKVKEVYSRNSENADKLAARLFDTRVKNDPDFSKSNSEVFIISVSDNAYNDLINDLKIPEGRIAVHTSGTLALDILQKFSPATGVFYPLQTFSKERKLDFEKIPVFIESKDAETEMTLTEIGVSITGTVRYLNSEKRRSLHVAAVFACNFVNFMLSRAKKVLEKEKIDFSLFEPLILETVKKAVEKGPENSQTGPAKRKDMNILKEHEEYLKGNPDMLHLYKSLSEMIIKEYE